MKRVISFILIFTIIITYSISVSGAKTIEQLKNEQSTLKTNKNQTQNLLEQIKSQKSTVFQELESLDLSIHNCEEDIQTIENELENFEIYLSNTQLQLNEATEQKDSQYDVLKKRIKYLYEANDFGYLEVLLNAKDVSDLLNRNEYVRGIMQFDKELLDEMSTLEQNINYKIIQVNEQKEEIELLQSMKISYYNDLQSAKDTKSELMDQLENDEETYMQTLKELEAASNEVESLIKKAEAEAAKKKQTLTYSGGKFTWPVPGYLSTSSGYINRNNPVSGKREFHTGIDIPAPKGKKVVAGADGTVVTASRMSGYGITVIINHGSGFSTLYAHNSKLLVSVGQKVTRGQAIAEIGSTGNSTGPHCHFEVRINGVHKNPWNYLK